MLPPIAAHIASLLDRAEVRAQFQVFGVSVTDAKARVAALSDDEAAQLADQIDSLPTGADGLGALVGAAVLVFLVLLITDLLERREIAEGTMAFCFAKPAGFQFKAGQSVRITLINPPETDDKGNARPFSVASAPSEDHLMIATRMRDTAFKRVLKTMPLTPRCRSEARRDNLSWMKAGRGPVRFLPAASASRPLSVC